MASVKAAIRVRAGNPEVGTLEAALMDPQAAATPRAEALAALAAVAGRGAARRAAFAARVQLVLFQRAVSTALTAIGATSHAAAVLAATDLDGAIAASGLDASCLALAESLGLDGMVAHICKACGPQRDAVVVSALNAVKAAADGT